MTITEEQWTAAVDRTKRAKVAYDELVGMPGVNTGPALTFINSFLVRYGNGERSQGLYDDMMEIEDVGA